MPTLYTFDEATGELTGSRPARENPRRKGEPIVPALATLMPPPLFGDRQVPVWDAAAGGWRTEIDRRGESWWNDDGDEHVIEAIGETPPPDAVLDPPPGPDHVRSGGAWVPRPAFGSVEAAKAAVVAWIEAFEVRVTKPRSSGERESWRKQEPAARAVLAGAAEHEGYAILDGIRGVTGETRVELAEQIVGAAEQYERLIGPLIGYRRSIFAAIDAADTLEEVEAATADGLEQLQQFAKAAAGGAS